MRVTVGVSNRHAHLTKDTYKYLFNDKEIEKRNDLNQIGEFASTDTIDIIYGEKTIEHVRILGPFREKNQIELLASDLKHLNLDAPTRKSGNLENTPKIILKNGNKTVETDGVIHAERHVHVPESLEQILNIHEGDEVIVMSKTSKFNAFVKVSPNATLEIHIDKDEAKEYDITNGQEVEMYHVED